MDLAKICQVRYLIFIKTLLIGEINLDGTIIQLRRRKGKW